MADEIALLPTISTSSTHIETRGAVRDKWYCLEPFDPEGAVLAYVMHGSNGMTVTREFQVDRFEAPVFEEPTQYVITLFSDGDEDTGEISCDMTVQAYERWAVDMHLGDDTKLVYEFGDEFKASDLNLWGNPNIEGTPLMDITTYTCSIPFGTRLYDSSYDITVTHVENTRDEDFRIVPRIYTLTYAIEVTPSDLCGIEIDKLEFDPLSNRPKWEEAVMYNVYNDGAIRLLSHYPEWDSYEVLGDMGSPYIPRPNALLQVSDDTTMSNPLIPWFKKGRVMVKCTYSGHTCIGEATCRLNDYRVETQYGYGWLCNNSSNTITYNGIGEATYVAEMDVPWVTECRYDGSYSTPFIFLRVARMENITVLTPVFQWRDNTRSYFTDLYIPKCTEIELDALKGRGRWLERVTILTPSCTLHNDAFGFTFGGETYLCNENLVVYVKSEYLDDYRNAEWWSNIADHIQGV